MTRNITTLFLGLTFLSCNQTQTTQEKLHQADTVKQAAIKVVTTPTINDLLDKALMTDTVEFNNEFKFDTLNSFLFFNSGHILNKTEKNAITVRCLPDTTYSIKLFSIKDNIRKRSVKFF